MLESMKLAVDSLISVQDFSNLIQQMSILTDSITVIRDDQKITLSITCEKENVPKITTLVQSNDYFQWGH